MPQNIPVQLTSFIGREREIAQLNAFLASTRLLTLTGAGGVGKTRLAFQVAAGSLDRFADGVWAIDLAPLADPALVVRTAASALGVTEESGREGTDVLVAGGAMTPDEAIECALESGAAPPKADAVPGGLTAREREVAGLVAEGMSNREIAARLVVTERTAETHVQNILNKLGFSSRAQIAAWAARNF